MCSGLEEAMEARVSGVATQVCLPGDCSSLHLFFPAYQASQSQPLVASLLWWLHCCGAWQVGSVVGLELDKRFQGLYDHVDLQVLSPLQPCIQHDVGPIKHVVLIVGCNNCC